MSDQEGYRNVFLDMISIMMLSTVPVMLACITGSDKVLVLLSGPQWAAAAPIFGWICVGGWLPG